MRIHILLTWILLSNVGSAIAQAENIDSINQKIRTTTNDTVQLILLEKIANIYSETNPDSAFLYAQKSLAIAKRTNLQLEEVVALGEMGYAMLNMGNYPRSLQYLLVAISMAEDERVEKNILPLQFPATDDFTDRSVPPRLQRMSKLSRVLQYAGILYGNSGNYQKAIDYFNRAIPLADQAKNLRILSITYTTLGRTYSSYKKQDSALRSLRLAHDYATKANYNRYLGSIYLNLGRVHLIMGDSITASTYFQKALQESTTNNYFRGIVASDLALADLQKKYNNTDSALIYLRRGLEVANGLNAPDLYLRIYASLTDVYHKTPKTDSTLKYQALIIRINDSLFSTKQIQQFQNIDFDAQQKKMEIDTAKKDYQNLLQKSLLLIGLVFLLTVAIILLRNNRNRKKTNILLTKKNNEIETTLANLKSTQAQLVQSEKMASLGELTAGIAHEIQNPLNFVINFCDINQELISELQDNILSGNGKEAQYLADDIKENQSKISLHGKRADAIVKSMLQHSRSASGQKEWCNVNQIVEEYFRLGYHGYLAKDQNFSASIHWTLDPSAGKLNILRQEIGRVLLNLYNNAFYAVQEKSRTFPDFKGIISIATQKVESQVLIMVSDNGNGISEKALPKIFQPFFTTKPTGEGTGLGLSLSYDIVKAHGGELKVQTKEGEGSSFTIILPVL